MAGTLKTCTRPDQGPHTSHQQHSAVDSVQGTTVPMTCGTAFPTEAALSASSMPGSVT